MTCSFPTASVRVGTTESDQNDRAGIKSGFILKAAVQVTALVSSNHQNTTLVGFVEPGDTMETGTSFVFKYLL